MCCFDHFYTLEGLLYFDPSQRNSICNQEPRAGAGAIVVNHAITILLKTQDFPFDCNPPILFSSEIGKFTIRRMYCTVPVSVDFLSHTKSYRYFSEERSFAIPVTAFVVKTLWFSSMRTKLHVHRPNVCRDRTFHT